MLASADVSLDTLFREELQDNLGVLSDGLRQLENGTSPDNAAAVVRDLFRAAHNLKGAAHSAGVDVAIAPCRRLEERLAAVCADQAPVDADFLASAGEEVAALAEVVERLNAALPGAAANAADEGRPPHPPAPGAEGRTRVAVRALDDLVHQTVALSAATDQLRVLTEYLGILRDTTNGPLGAILADFNDLERTLGRAVGQISATAQRLRMEPIDDVTVGMDHIVRELCRTTGKRARLVFEGGDVEVDRDVADAIREPLLHLVRNAVGHGIESPDDRIAGWKAPEGTIRLSAALDGGRVRIAVEDDGAGIDIVALRTAAADSSGAIDNSELAFLPGVSTAAALTDVSGRGMGLDAVRARVESLGGSVRLNSSVGAGTEVVLHVPISLAVLRVILVRVAGELVALPVAAVERVRRATAGQIQIGEGTHALVEAESKRPALYLGGALGLSECGLAGRETTVVELAGEETVLLVDSVESDRDTLLQPLPPRLRANRLLMGAVLLPQGRVALVVNPSTCVRKGRRQ